MATPRRRTRSQAKAEAEVEGDMHEDHGKVLTIPGTSSQLRQHDDGTVEFFRKPHTIIVLVISIALLIFVSFSAEDRDTTSNVKNGLLAIMFGFLLFSLLQLRDGPFVRPHPAFWRVIQGCTILYLMFMMFLLFQKVEDARFLFTYYDPSLNRKLPERGYAEDCRIYTPEDPESNFRNLRDTVFDEFILAHLLGWWGKMILFRDIKLALVASVEFEFVEMAFEHVLPNFRECWWDHIFLDLLGCNLIGMLAGVATCRYFEMKTYDWIGYKQIRTVKGKVKRAFLQATPRSWDRNEWKPLSSWRYYLAMLFIVVSHGVVDANAFFLKTVLLIPPSSPLNAYRLLLIFLITVPAFREFYQFVNDPTCEKMGTQAWLTTAVYYTELLVWVKFSLETGLWSVPTPPLVVAGWALTGFVTLVVGPAYFVVKHLRSRSYEHRA